MTRPESFRCVGEEPGGTPVTVRQVREALAHVPDDYQLWLALEMDCHGVTAYQGGWLRLVAFDRSNSADDDALDIAPEKSVLLSNDPLVGIPEDDKADYAEDHPDGEVPYEVWLRNVDAEFKAEAADSGTSYEEWREERSSRKWREEEARHLAQLAARQPDEEDDIKAFFMGKTMPPKERDDVKTTVRPTEYAQNDFGNNCPHLFGDSERI